ncbi:MAG TPA: guanylate kinase [Flavobacteriales bacterium]|nr:guanylate kinase [Flavobacteriales bacterium]
MEAKGKSIIFSAPSGAGKTTIVRALLASDLPLEFSISACSRPVRGEEVDKKDYYFLGINGFKEAIDNDALLEWGEVYPDQFYGTLKSEIDRIWSNNRAVIFDVDVYGGLELKKRLGDQALSIFVMPPTREVLEARLRSRKTESEEKIRMRLKKADEELSMHTEFDHVLLNDDLDRAVKEASQTITRFFTK